jgi:histidinol-phosphate phosphatase family protein
MNKAVFLDRDGVINRKAAEGEYVVRWEEFELLPGVAEAIRDLNRAAYQVIVVTNQRAVARNIITLLELETLHRRLIVKLAELGGRIDGIYFCPHDLEDNCECRKPKPGMLLRALEEFQIDPKASWMVGDSEVDIQAGQRSACRTALITTNYNRKGAEIPADILAENLQQAVAMILMSKVAVRNARPV